MNKEISYRLRESIIDALSPLIYEGEVIPIFDVRVNPMTVLANIQNAECYVVINSQNSQETTNDKCQIRLDSNINFDVVTKYTQGYGGSLLSEKIGELIMQKINRSLIIADFDLLYVQMNFSTNLIENGISLDLYRKILSYRFDVFER